MPSLRPETNSTQATGSGRDEDVEWFHYIEIGDLPRWEARGWVILTVLNEYAALGKWPHKWAPTLPNKHDEVAVAPRDCS